MKLFQRKPVDPGYRPFVLPESAPKPKLKIAHDAVLRSKVAPRPLLTPQQTWALPKPFPGVLPPLATEGGTRRRLAMDDVPNLGALYSFAQSSFFREGLGFLGYPYLAELTQRAEYRRVSEIIAKEMTRKFIKLTIKGDKDPGGRLGALNDEMLRLNLAKTFQKVAEHDGWFGVSHLYPNCGYDTGDRGELESILILNKAKVPKGSLKGFKVVEPWWTYPAMFQANDPLAEDFYRMKHWYVMGKRVHASRLMSFIGREVPDMLKPMYCFGGISLSQIAKPYIDNWLETRQGVNDIVQAFSTWVLKTNMAAIMEGGGLGAAEDLSGRLEMFNNFRNNAGVMAIDKDAEDFLNVAAPIAGLHELQAQSQEHICSVTGIPLVVYTGITPSGLNASSEGEIQVWENWINSYQEHLFRPNLTRALQFLQLSLFGEIIPDIGFEFEPLRAEKALDTVTIQKTKADIDTGYIQAGVIAPEEARERLQADENSPYAGIDLSGPPPEPPDLGDPDEGGPPGGEKEPGEEDDKPAQDAWNEGDHPRDDLGRFGAGPGGVAGAHSEHAAAKKPIPAKHFSAASYADTHNDPGATMESVLSHFPAETAARIAETAAKVDARGRTIDAHRGPDGSYTPERLQIQRDVLEKPFTDKKGKVHPPIWNADRVAAATPAPGERPKFIMLGGRGGSGKSKLENRVYDPNKFLVLDADKIKERLPEFEGWNANEVHEESSDILDRVITAARAMGLNVVLDATMKTQANALSRIKEFKADGYETEAHYMHLPRQEAAKRAIQRFMTREGDRSGRFVPPHIVLGNTENERNFDEARKLADRWSFRDNNVGEHEEPILISEGSKARGVIDAGKRRGRP